MKCLICLLLFSLLFSCADNKNNVSLLMMNYYKNKNESDLKFIIKYFNEDNLDDSAYRAIFPFLLGIKFDQTNDFKIENYKPRNYILLNVVKSLNSISNIDVYLNNKPRTPDLNDELFALYFASGNTKYIEYLIKIINNIIIDNKSSENSKMIKLSGIWALKSLSQTDDNIGKYIKYLRIHNKYSQAVSLIGPVKINN